jgi:SAM-dependent methyltransferase
VTEDPTRYRGRRLTEGYPGLDARSVDWFQASVANRPDDAPRLQTVLHCLDRLIDIGQARKLLVVGCGPQPETMRLLREMGFAVCGVEPVPKFVAAARKFLGDDDAVLQGFAERLPNASGSQDVVLLESVLEHVDSVESTLAEAYRVLAAGGIAYISTTNRHRLGGLRAEFNVRFYPLLPSIVKESYVFHHLHYDPSLANFTERPAVHWFTYAELCNSGREAGFHEFYSPLDLRAAEPWTFSGGERKRRLKAHVLVHIQRKPWLRALALSQRGGIIFMVKRR